MAYVITDTCIKDELCIDACPVDCIHPKKDEPAFEAATQLYIDPNGCIDCGACIPVCASESIHPADELSDEQKPFIEKNAEFYATVN
jgi:NAD-dependent dihydropyrimidine dehydrogenase PreA subunit